MIVQCYCVEDTHGADVNVSHKFCRRSYPKFLLGMGDTMQEIRDEVIRATNSGELIPCTLVDDEDSFPTMLKVASVG